MQLCTSRSLPINIWTFQIMYEFKFIKLSYIYLSIKETHLQCKCLQLLMFTYRINDVKTLWTIRETLDINKQNNIVVKRNVVSGKNLFSVKNYKNLHYLFFFFPVLFIFLETLRKQICWTYDHFYKYLLNFVAICIFSF